MMSKFLLLLCFTAVHVLGEGQENVSTKNIDVFTVTSLHHDSEQFETTPSNKIVSVEPVSVPLYTDKNKRKSEEVLTNQSSVQSSTVAPNHSTVAPPDTKATLTYTNESSIEQISHAAANPVVVRTPISFKMLSRSSGKWIVANGTSEICIVLQMSAMFNISYNNTNGTTSYKVFDIPTDNTTTASGSCGETEQTLTLEWSSKNTTNASMTLHFVKNSTENYSFHHLEVILPAPNFSNATLNKSMDLVHKASNFVVGVSNSYRCLKQQKLSLKQNDSNQTSGYLIVSGLQFQAFKTDNSTVFGLAKDCAFDTPDVVPIAVGCALGGLVIIVLIAYLVGRRRSRNQDYVSM